MPQNSENQAISECIASTGITQQFSAARTPQQNGVVERRNRTLMEAARTMLSYSNLPQFLWADAIATACYTQNRSIINKRFCKTPYEIINNRLPNLKFLHVFGCKCFVLNDREDRGKLHDKADEGVFIGYSQNSAAFRVYIKRIRSVKESTNVSFDESVEDITFQPTTVPSTSASENASASTTTSTDDLDFLFDHLYLQPTVIPPEVVNDAVT